MVRLIPAAGAFVVSLDSMVNIAFPAIAAAFDAPPEQVRWVIICYTGSYAVMAFIAGTAADRIGHLPVFRSGLVLSVAGFALCGLAPTFGFLLAGRAVQGIAGGLVYGTAPALATLGAAPSLRGRRLGSPNAAIFAIWLLAPFYLVGVRGLSAAAGGLLFMLTPLGTAAAAPLAGRLADRLGAHAPMIAGLVLEAVGLGALSRADASTPLATVALALCAAGFGLGVFQVPNMAVVMAAFPAAHQGAACGLTFLARTLGLVTGVAVLAAVFAQRRVDVGVEPAFAEAFALAALVVPAAALAGGAARPYTRGR